MYYFDQIFGAAVETIGNHKAIMKMYPGDMPYESEKLEGFRNDVSFKGYQDEGNEKRQEEGRGVIKSGKWADIVYECPLTYFSKFCIYFLFYIMHKM